MPQAIHGVRMCAVEPYRGSLYACSCRIALGCPKPVTAGSRSCAARADNRVPQPSRTGLPYPAAQLRLGLADLIARLQTGDVVPYKGLARSCERFASIRMLPFACTAPEPAFARQPSSTTRWD